MSVIESQSESYLWGLSLFVILFIILVVTTLNFVKMLASLKNMIKRPVGENDGMRLHTLETAFP